MKVLYLGVWKDGTGWGNAAQNYILALDSMGIDVVPRSISLSEPADSVDIPQRILELEENDETGCDICIQHILPHVMEHHGHFDLNIGVFYCETTHFRNTTWAEHLNLMDQVWVANRSMLSASINSYVHAPLAVVPLCFDVSAYSQRYQPYPIPEAQDKFVFYTMGTITRRKNLAGLLKAFHLEFTPHEPVCLIIKGNSPGLSPMETNKLIKVTIDEIKNGLRLYPSLTNYHNEILITQWMSHDNIMRLHKTGNCFVLPSYGEAWGIPGFEAMALGNPVILTGGGGPGDYVEHYKSGMLIPARLEPVFIRPEEAPLPDIWTSNEDWYSPDLLALQYFMRKIYQDKDLRTTMGENGIDRAYNFSLQTVGKQMEELLDGTTKPILYDRSTALRQKHNMSSMVR